LLRVALKGLLARKLRTVLTAFAVVIGVAFVSGTFVFTDTIDASFKDLFERTQRGVDVSVQQKQAVEVDFASPPTMPKDTLERVQAVDGVEEAAGFVSYDRGALLDRDGEPILSNGPPTIIVTAGPDRFDPFDYTEGGPPETDDEVVLDKATADKYDFGEGDTVTVVGSTPKKEYTVSGVGRLGDSENFGGSRLVVMTLPEAQRVSGHDGYDDISVAAAGGSSPEEVKAAIAAELGPGFSVLTGKEQAEKSASDLSDALGFIRTALLVFAAVAVLVGGFLIFNTFNVTVAQRTREIALLRTLGASRPQVMRSVLLETVVVGLIASVLGVAAGLIIAPALRELMAASGIELATTDTQLQPRTIIVGLIVGIVATVVSGIVPARRATRVEPLAAMRDADIAGAAPLRRRRIVASAVLALLGVAVMLLALTGGTGSASSDAYTLGLGAILLMFGFALVAATLVRPLSSLVGKPIERLRGLTGRLARENARRQPQRTAVTASALMIGVALVVFVAIFAAGILASVDDGIDRQVRADGIITHEDNFSPLPDDVIQALQDVDGVAAVSSVRFETGERIGDDSGNQAVTGIDPSTAPLALSLEWEDGSDEALADLGTDEVVVDKEFATARDLAIGDELELRTPADEEVAYRVSAIYKPRAGVVSGPLVSNDSLTADWNSKDVALALTVADQGTSPEQLKQAEESALQGFPTAKPQTIDDYKETSRQGIMGLVGLIYALLSLSIIVALVGVVNTLALSVHERTRELGMLRAVGMARSQVRAMVRAESVITAAIGTVLGMVLGIAFAAIVSRPLASQGFVFEVPILALVIVAILAGLAGVLAAIQPARRAARVDVLRAVTTE
jgi:putative ABC transport system permease protein